MPNVYNKQKAAEALGISTETIDRYRKNGKLPFHRIGDRVLFTESDLSAFLDACAISATVKPTEKEKTVIAKATATKSAAKNAYEYESEVHFRCNA
jgi:excisionase family DNA binding protein